MTQDNNIEATINEAIDYIVRPQQDQESSNQYLSNAVRKITDARIALLLGYDSLDKECALRFSEKLSLTEKLYSAKTEMIRLADSERWRNFVERIKRE
jgi:hypothetical protein